MKYFFQIIFKLILIFLGCGIITWVFWRFFREYLPQNVPLESLTEYRFWVLLYICGLYLYIIKNTLYPKPPKEIIVFLAGKFSHLFYFPVQELDKLLKYNFYVKPYYYKFTSFILDALYPKHLKYIIFITNIIPRSILVFILCLDIFYFHKIQTFYSFIFLGVFPLLLRYYKYCFIDLKEHYLQVLENKYESVLIFEEDYLYDRDHIGKSDAIYHYHEVNIRRYFEIKYENYDAWLADNVNFEYVGIPFCKEIVYVNYKEYKKKQHLTLEDYEVLDKDFHDIMLILLEVQRFYSLFCIVEVLNVIKRPKIIILCVYLICWSYFLIVSTLRADNIQLTLLELLSKNVYWLLDQFYGI